ncbi:hypothetical protein VQ056_13305 [Paenibacillus sp. JTLBN-2024]
MTYDFDRIISRFGTNSAKWDGMAQAHGKDMIALSVADMDLQAPPKVVEQMSRIGAARDLWIYGSVSALL